MSFSLRGSYILDNKMCRNYEKVREYNVNLYIQVTI